MQRNRKLRACSLKGVRWRGVHRVLSRTSGVEDYHYDSMTRTGCAGHAKTSWQRPSSTPTVLISVFAFAYFNSLYLAFVSVVL